MRFAVVGAGATGGYLGGMLARAGEDVTLIARGAHLAAMRGRGLRVLLENEEFTVHPRCTDDLNAIREAQAVFLTVKAQAVPPLAPTLGAALGPETAVVFAQNGIPWWYFDRYEGPLAGTQLQTVDPGGVIRANLSVERAIGCVVWPATELVEPGVVRHIEGTRFSLGEPNDERTERVESIAKALSRAGLKAPVSRSIRHDIWLKLLGNVAFNPISALTRATLEEIAKMPESRAVAHAVMTEAESVARALGVELAIGVEKRLAGAEKVGAHKSSMLQDVEQGRPLEIEAMVGAVVELGNLLGLAIPHLRTVYACAHLLNQTLSNSNSSSNSSSKAPQISTPV